MNLRDFGLIIGIQGVLPDETDQAKKWAQRFEGPMIVISIWIMVEWYVSTRMEYPAGLATFSDWLIWSIFALETLTVAYFVREKRRYLIGNWLNVVVIVLGIGVIFGVGMNVAALRILRLALLVPLLLKVSGSVRRLLMRHHLGLTLLVGLLFTLLSGMLIAGIDPAIGSVADGIWWAWVTIATVGYGDIVPDSPAGRLFASVIILFGVGFFSLLTASFAAFFITDSDEKSAKEEKLVAEHLRQIETRVAKMESVLKRIERKLDDDG